MNTNRGNKKYLKRQNVCRDRSFWNKAATKYEGFYIDQKLASYKSREYIKVIKKWVGEVSGTILVTDLFDAAFGDRHYLNFLKNKKSRVFGIDISSVITDKGKSNNIALSGSVVCDVRRLPFKNSSFHMIISPSTLDHFPEISEALKELYRVLKIGRILILSLNNKHNPFFLFNIFFYSFFNLFGFYVHKCYTFHETERLLVSVGFKVEEQTAIMHIPFLFPTLCKFANSRNFSLLKQFTHRLLALLEGYGNESSRINKYTGWWMPFKGRKC
jgi:SAM-dependent methyltransferase